MANKFEYKYKAPTQEERQEINNILNDYLPKNESNNKLDYLRKLDFKVKNIPMIVGLNLGIIGTLIFGLGLTCFLEWNLIILGFIFSLLGMIVAVMAYPLYKVIYKRMKNKYSDEIIKISNELLNR